MSDHERVAVGSVKGGPPGITLLAASKHGVVQVQLGGDQTRFIETLHQRSYRPGGESSWLCAAIEQLEQYFQGHRVDFACRIVFPAMSLFSQRVYHSLRAVAYGCTITYGELAKQAGNPKAARAVGRLMAKNPWPIFIPCHRVLAADGLGGFGPGLEMKKKLLALEQTSITMPSRLHCHRIADQTI